MAKGYANNEPTGAVRRQERILWLAPTAKREIKHAIGTILKNNTVFKFEGHELTAFKSGGA